MVSGTQVEERRMGSATSDRPDRLKGKYQAVRQMTERLASPLGPEDCQIQSMPDASPVKWHLAHTTWFFETFVLEPFASGFRVFHPSFRFLFNSYYNAIGDRLPRSRRGLMTRPSLDEIRKYRAATDRAVLALLDSAGDGLPPAAAAAITLGLNHEQQHQELILTDIKHALALNPLRPAYREESGRTTSARPAPPLEWLSFEHGLDWIGHDGTGFAFDNEGPRHRVFGEAFQLASRLVTCGEYLAFIDDGGYSRPELWLSDGSSAVASHQWEHPLYWEREAGAWWLTTLGGHRPLIESEPVCHLSYYEADAFARWMGCRLPTEFEWERAMGDQPVAGNLLESDQLHPRTADRGTAFAQTFGDAWEWTQSPYTPYPGMRPAAGALGEYNAKFMCNQLVLKGGSCATPTSHIRATYRNFFPPEARWQFSGIRLAKDV